MIIAIAIKIQIKVTLNQFLTYNLTNRPNLVPVGEQNFFRRALMVLICHRHLEHGLDLATVLAEVLQLVHKSNAMSADYYYLLINWRDLQVIWHD